MTTIAVGRVPPKLTMALFVRKMSWLIKGHFETLGFTPAKKNQPKVCYIKLSPKLDVNAVLHRINSEPVGKSQFKAYIPNSIPKFVETKKTHIPRTLRRILKIPNEMKPEICFVKVHKLIIREMEHKYTGLYDLSSKTDHKLLNNICLTVRDRLRLLARNTQVTDVPFKFTRAYRKAHPHFGDFQLILSTLHALEDAQGKPRSQICEKDLMVVKNISSVNQSVIETGELYAQKIIKKITEHINNLKMDVSTSPTAEERAKIEVRTQIKKLAPFMPHIVNEIVTKYFKPVVRNFVKVQIYGEPNLPNFDLMEPLMKRNRARAVHRADDMFNLLQLKVTQPDLSKLMELDGAEVGNCKLIIRGVYQKFYEFPPSLEAAITLKPTDIKDNMDTDDKNWEQW